MPIFSVKLERQDYQVIFVEADEPEDAIEAAWELAEERDWLEENTDQEVIETVHTPARYWTGGEGGHWVGT